MKPVPRLSNASPDYIAVLSKIKKVEADNDWDGISSAIQIKHHFPEIYVRISGEKSVPSDEETLVLDMGTNGMGWVIDHHPINSKSKNLLNFCPSGDVSTGRLTYEVLPEKTAADLFISATSEISDGLYEYGLLHGSLKELSQKEPYYFKKSEKTDQFMIKKEIFVMSDIFSTLAMNMPDSVFKLGAKLYENTPKNTEELKALLSPKEAALVEEYLSFMDAFPENLFKPHKLKSYEISVADARDIGKFSNIALARTRMKYPGNYLLFRGNHISLRTPDLTLFETMISVLGDNVRMSGGRKEWHGITLKEEMSYSHFLAILDKNHN